MKKFLFWLTNLVLIVGTGGFWLLVLVPYLLWKKANERKQQVQIESDTTYSSPETTTVDRFLDGTTLWIKTNQIAAISIGSALVVLLASFSFGGDYLQDRKVESLFSEAESLISEDNFADAEKKVNEILSVDASMSSRVQNVRNRIVNIQAANELFAEAAAYELNGENLKASLAIKQVRSSDKRFPAKVNSELSRLEPKVIEEVREQLAQSNSSRNYKKALDLINQFSRAYPSNSEFTAAKERLTEALEKQEAAVRRVALSRLNKRYDSFQDVTWYSSPSSPRYRNANGFYLYFGVSGSSKLPLRLVLQYYSSDWLFIEDVKVNVDGSVYTISNTDWERDNDSNIWEWSDETLEDRSLIEKIIKSKSTVIRYEGRQYYDTRTLSSAQKLALKLVLDAYDAF